MSPDWPVTKHLWSSALNVCIIIIIIIIIINNVIFWRPNVARHEFLRVLKAEVTNSRPVTYHEWDREVYSINSRLQSAIVWSSTTSRSFCFTDTHNKSSYLNSINNTYICMHMTMLYRHDVDTTHILWVVTSELMRRATWHIGLQQHSCVTLASKLFARSWTNGFVCVIIIR